MSSEKNDNTAPSAPEGSALTADFSASVVVFLVALPLCMGIAIASGVPVSRGLITGIVGGILVGMFQGGPMSVSGPAAGLVVLVVGAIAEHGMAGLGVVVCIDRRTHRSSAQRARCG